MSRKSQVSSLTSCKNPKWLWLLVPSAMGLLSFESYLVLQLLSALVLFALLFASLAVLAGAFALCVIAADHLLQGTVDALAPIGLSTHMRSLGKAMYKWASSPYPHMHIVGRA